jgi:alpha-methylacyl-CoA racemase
VAALEPQFYAQLLDRLGITADAPDREDPANWPALRALLADTVRRRTRAEWTAVFEDSDACVAPVLTWAEAHEHPHLRARGTYVVRDGVPQPAPAPRFSRTPGALRTPPARPGEHTRAALTDWGVPDVDALLASGAVSEAR